jgi:hypothetical protein
MLHLVVGFACTDQCAKAGEIGSHSNDACQETENRTTVAALQSGRLAIRPFLFFWSSDAEALNVCFGSCAALLAPSASARRAEQEVGRNGVK